MARLHDARERLKEEMIHVVEDVLKHEAPKEDFRRRVVELLNCYEGGRHWSETLAELRKLGGDVIPGFVEAFKLPHWQSRRFAAQMLTHAMPRDERVVELLKGVISDSNKKVRKHAASLLNLDVDDERKQTEFLPLLLPLLRDGSGVVRWRTAYELLNWAADVPLEVAAEALANEKNAKVRGMLAHLVRRIIYLACRVDCYCKSLRRTVAKRSAIIKVRRYSYRSCYRSCGRIRCSKGCNISQSRCCQPDISVII